MTGRDATGTLVASVEVHYGQWYLFDADAPATLVDLLDDPVAQAEVWEQKCAASGGAAIVYTLKSYGSTGVVVRSVPSPPPLDERADHVAECSIAVTGGRLAISGWDSSVVVGVIRVPDGPLRVRIGWLGLDPELATDDNDVERFELDVFPGPPGPLEILRCWPTWEPAPGEATTQDGLRRFSGRRAVQARESMERIPLIFGTPYPETPDGPIAGLWRDPRDDSRWAEGSRAGGEEVLRELTDEEAAAIEAQGFPSVYTYAIDGDGRIWTSGLTPLERVPCLNLMPRWQFEMVTGITGGLVGDRVIDLPQGWSRIVRLPPDGQGTRVEVTSIDEADGGRYQRWRDDEPLSS